MRNYKLFLASMLLLAGCDRDSKDSAKASAERAVDRTEQSADRAVEVAKDKAEAIKDRIDENAEAAKARIDRNAEASKEAADRKAQAVEHRGEHAVEKAEQGVERAENKLDRAEDRIDRADRPGGPGNNGVPTAGDQSETTADRELTRRLRQAVVEDDSLSLQAKNIQIITIDGKVTLRGEVNTEAERAAILAKAKRFATQIDNRLTLDKN